MDRWTDSTSEGARTVGAVPALRFWPGGARAALFVEQAHAALSPSMAAEICGCSSA
jgi:hypothetical protein